MSAGTPGWFDLALSAFGGFVVALVGAFTAAWNLSGQIRGLEIKLLEQNAKLKDEIDNKIDRTADKLDDRLRRVEQFITSKH